MKKYEICEATRKKKRSRRDAINLLRNSETVNSIYQCEYCKMYHVSSLTTKFKKKIDEWHSKVDINTAIQRRLDKLTSKR